MSGKVSGWRNEEELWQAFQAGNETAFARLYELYVDTLFSYCTRFTPDRDLVKDCIHDLFVELWKSRSTVSTTTSVRFYLLACIKRKVLRQLEKAHAKGAGSSVAREPDATLSHEAALIQQQEWEQLQTGLQQALGHLTKRQREAIFFKFYQNLPYEQIASAMNVNAQSVYNLIFCALRTLKKNLPAESAVLTLLITLALG
jgi:RNA polymerase sigma factor (sigma-70 family)